MTQLEKAVFCQYVVLEVGAIRARHDPPFLNLKLAENILLEDFTNRTFGCARAPIDHVKRTAAEALRVCNQILRLRPAACNHCLHQVDKDCVGREIPRGDALAWFERPENLANDSF